LEYKEIPYVRFIFTWNFRSQYRAGSFGTWNVRSLYTAASFAAAARELDRYKLELICV